MAFPATSSLALGVPVPIPTLPPTLSIIFGLPSFQSPIAKSLYIEPVYASKLFNDAVWRFTSS